MANRIRHGSKKRMYWRMVSSSLIRRASRLIIAVLAIAIGATILSGLDIARMVILIVAVILFFVTVLGSIPAIRYLTALKPTEVLHGK